MLPLSHHRMRIMRANTPTMYSATSTKKHTNVSFTICLMKSIIPPYIHHTKKHTNMPIQNKMSRSMLSCPYM